MNIKNTILAFMIVSVIATEPVMAAVESKDKVEQAKTALKTFRKDIKCVFSREGCTREQKIRLAKQGLGLLTVIAVLGGGGWLAWKSRVKKREETEAERRQQSEREHQAQKAEEARRERERGAAQRKQEQLEKANQLAREQETERLAKERQEETARHEQERVEREEAARRASVRREAIAQLEGVHAEKKRALEQARREQAGAREALNKINRIVSRTKKGEKELRLSAKQRRYGRVGFFAQQETAQKRFDKAQESFNAKEKELIAAGAALERARAGH